ncbi:MAG: putative ABC transport system permease protein [Candidatus Paceibacteria bacterium]|jgi:putative ABC transport system permease protein
MNPFNVFLEALQALRSNALRSSLTIVGIVVGIFSVTAMLALGEGLSGNIEERFNNFTSGDITVVGDITEQDFGWLQSRPYALVVVGTQSASGVTTIFSGSDFDPSIQTILGDYEAITGFELISGKSFDFTDPDFDERVAIVDEGFLESVETDTGTDASTGVVTLNGQRFTIIGVREGGNGGFGRRGDGAIIVPYAAALGVVTNTTHFSSVGMNLKDVSYYETYSQHILTSLNASRYVKADSDEFFGVSSAQEFIETALETTAMISVFLGVIGGIALFVGGIGTMNMMLTTVTERTKEIGLRKAVGARNKDVLLQILFESILLTLFGGAIGIAITYGVAFVANRVLAENNFLSVEMSGTVVLYAVIVSFCVGIIFGLYPARNASRLQPVDALRSD